VKVARTVPTGGWRDGSEDTALCPYPLGMKLQGSVVGRSVWQQPLQEELYNGYAASLVSAPCGDGFQTARVLTNPFRMLCDREGVFSAQRSPSPHAFTTGTTTSQDFRGVHVAFTCLTPILLTPWYPHDDGGMPLRLPS
jgi:hypothetical protein